LHVDRADQVGILFEAALDAFEKSLRFAVVLGIVYALRTRLGSVLWRYGEKLAACSEHLVLQLAPELGPALVQNWSRIGPELVQNGPIQARLCPHVPARLFDSAGGRARHILHLQIFNNDQVNCLLRNRRTALFGSFLDLRSAAQYTPGQPSLDVTPQNSQIPDVL
jgi:hypothetical protein